LPNKKTILIVDDSATNIDVIGGILHPFYTIHAANSGERALKSVKNSIPDLILLDVMMPDMDGYAVKRILKEDTKTQDIPVIFVTAMNDTADEELGLELGAVDYITKPVRPAILLARVHTQLKLKEALDSLKIQNTDLEAEVQRRISENLLVRDVGMAALSNLAKTRDNETGNHILRTQAYVEVLARELSLKPTYALELTDARITSITKAAPLHDIGKVGTPDAILLKPDKLTPAEFKIMKEHAKLGADALRECINDNDPEILDFLTSAIEIANYHHEKWDGSGYPEGLSGTDIPISARLMALADVFDALISRRCYKPPFTLEKSVRIILEGSGSHFDPDIVKVFENKKQEFYDIAERYSDDENAFKTEIEEITQL